MPEKPPQSPNPTALPEPAPVAAAAMRLNRFLARSGVASRRKSDELIRDGKVRVNGETILEPWHSIVLAGDRVEVQGRRVALPAAFEYIAYHKPAGTLVTRRDVRGRPTVFDQFTDLHPGTVAVGRLDLDTTGLLLLTDDGELAFRLMHPSFAVDKLYAAVVRGRPDQATLAHLRAGIELDDGMTAPARVEIQESRPAARELETQLEICIHEGRKRQIRRMFRTVGHPVRALKRVAFAGLKLDLPRPGQWRYLTPVEVAALRSQVGLG